jgi:hypothetical protein
LTSLGSAQVRMLIGIEREYIGQAAKRIGFVVEDN